MQLVGVIALCLVSLASSLPHQKTRAPPDGRIIGGNVAEPKQFPWHVAIYFDTDDGTYFCNGALIHPQWVLTAAHCVSRAKIFTIRLGSNSLVDLDPNRVEYTLTQWALHPEYDPNSLTDDIGLIRIDIPVITNEYIQIIPLATTPLGSNVSVTVSGWGATGNWGGAVNYLNYVNLNTISNAECQTFYGQAVTESIVCAVGKNNEGTCSGDSGAPLIVTDDLGQAVHVGIVSWTSANGCETSDPSGYTRTASYVDWINAIIYG